MEKLLEEAAAFSKIAGNSFALRLMRFFTRCEDSAVFGYLVRRLYTRSIPSNTYRRASPAAMAYVELLLLPFACLLRKKIVWRRGRAVEITLETIDKPYFQWWFERMYQNLRGTKQVTPRSTATFGKGEVTEPIDAFICTRDLLWLFVICPLSLVPLLFLRLRSGLDVTAEYARSLYNYAKFNGYFRRYPCHHFITYSDETNHPCRYIAFHQNCSGELIVIQNGERTYHPQFAFGMTDRYFVFGKAYETILRAIGVYGKDFPAVGALCLNHRYELVTETQRNINGTAYDIIFLDQSLFPYSNLCRRSCEGIEMTLRNLNLFKRRHPECRIVYQLRNYLSDSAEKEDIIKRVKSILTEDIPILDNQGNGESYVNIVRSNVVMTFESTLGFEALRIGRKVLFVNYSGDPAETICPDARFQLVDETGDYETFERRVLEILDMQLKDIPQVALDRHTTFDGKVQERIAEMVNG